MAAGRQRKYKAERTTYARVGTVCNAGNAITELLCSPITGHLQLPRAHCGGPVVALCHLNPTPPSNCGGMVLSLIRELIAHKPWGMAKKENCVPGGKEGQLT